MKECFVLLCRGNAKNTQLLSFTKHPLRSEQWLNANNFGWKDVKYKYVCIKHFEKNMLETKKRRTRVKPNGVPTSFCKGHVSEVIAGRVPSPGEDKEPPRGLR